MAALIGILWKTQPSISEPFCRFLKIASCRRVMYWYSTIGFLPVPVT